MSKKQRTNAGYKSTAKQPGQMKFLVGVTVVSLVIIVVLVIFLHPKNPSARFQYSSMPVLGNPDAPVKIVEFGDFKCPSCKYFSQHIEPKLKQDYIDKGKVALYFMNYTIIGPDSVTAALAAQSIFHQNNKAFWSFYTDIYNNQQSEKTIWATPDFLTSFAKKEKLPIDYNLLKKDIISKTYAKEVDKGNKLGDDLHVQSTPTLFINGRMFTDVFNYNHLQSVIQKDAKGHA